MGSEERKSWVGIVYLWNVYTLFDVSTFFPPILAIINLVHSLTKQFSPIIHHGSIRSIFCKIVVRFVKWIWLISVVLWIDVDISSVVLIFAAYAYVPFRCSSKCCIHHSITYLTFFLHYAPVFIQAQFGSRLEAIVECVELLEELPRFWNRGTACMLAKLNV